MSPTERDEKIAEKLAHLDILGQLRLGDTTQEQWDEYDTLTKEILALIRENVNNNE